jgi:hypothetical protein
MVALLAETLAAAERGGAVAEKHYELISTDITVQHAGSIPAWAGSHRGGLVWIQRGGVHLCRPTTDPCYISVYCEGLSPDEVADQMRCCLR